MQRVLDKMAKQLNNYDEASLMQLWQHYAMQVHAFEPSKRWEEAAIALCLIQAVHWKNQLFNYWLSETAAPPDKDNLPPLPDIFSMHDARSSKTGKDEKKDKPKGTVLRFPLKNDQEGTNSAGTEPSGQSEQNDAPDQSK